ncbi:SRPBCC family protein [Methylomagnum sp.]
MDERQLARGLGWFSIGLGLMEVAAPQRIANRLGLRGRRNLVRLFGMREIASGVGILAEQRPAGWLQARVAGDVMDLALLGSALTSDNPRRGGAALATAAVAGVTALDVMCSRRLSQGDGAMDGALHAERSIVIDRPPEVLYQFWRDLERLPQFMNHLESVRNIGPNRSHWVAKGPAGMRIKWDAEITQDQPNRFIAWQSLAGSDMDSAGWVRFEPAPGGRGTVVRVAMDYHPPAGALGAAVAKLFGQSPEKHMAGDLHRFKQLMETGEIARTEGQSAGRARGTSRKYDEYVRA